jgi:hypothetical protein
VGKYGSFTICDICGQYKRALQESNSLAERAALRATQMKHIEFVKGERLQYHTHNLMASLEPEKYLSMIIDGMDQKKTYLPWIWPLVR